MIQFTYRRNDLTGSEGKEGKRKGGRNDGEDSKKT